MRSSSIVDMARPLPNDVGSATTPNAGNGAIVYLQQDVVSAPGFKKEQRWESALMMVQSAANRMQHYEQVLRTMANDVIRITFRLNAEKAALETTIESVDRRLLALQQEHEIALDLLRDSQRLCLSLMNRLETFEAIPTELEDDLYRTAKHIKTMRNAAASRST